ncbi:hypothetical protein D3C86_1592910 [compost metagenome]
MAEHRVGARPGKGYLVVSNMRIHIGGNHMGISFIKDLATVTQQFDTHDGISFR